jgi:hypothetical protein
MAETDQAELLSVADELYGLDLGDFTPARDARAKDLKKEQPELSKQVKALKKPSLAAWVVNLLVRRETDQVEQVLSVGAALREAQAGLKGDELRALTRQRRQLTAAVTTRARGVARDEGQRITDSVADQVEATLTAAMVDPGCAQAVRSGLLLTALAATGVDAVDLGSAVAVPEALGFTATPRDTAAPARPELRVVPDPEADEKALTAAREVLEEAESELAGATQAHEAAVADVERLEARGMQLQAEIDELKRRLAEVEASYEEVEDELADAEDVREEAESSVASATKARDSAQEALDRLG